MTEWEMHITAQGPRLRNDLYCVEWDVKPVYHDTIQVQGGPSKPDCFRESTTFSSDELEMRLIIFVEKK